MTNQPTAEQPLIEFSDANADPQLTLHQTNLMLDFLENSPVPAMLIDIDGVILDNTHRLHHIVTTDEQGNQQPRPDADWGTFHAEAHQDTPGDYVELIHNLARHGLYAPVFLTARVEIWTHTRQKLVDHVNKALGLNFPLVSVIMRERQSSFGAANFKEHIVGLMKSRGIKIGFALDDSHSNCLEFRAHGIPTLRAYNHLRADALLY